MSEGLYFQKEWLKVCCENLVYAECLRCSEFACHKCLMKYHHHGNWKLVRSKFLMYFLEDNTKIECHFCGGKDGKHTHCRWLTLDLFKRTKINFRLAKKFRDDNYIKLAQRKFDELAVSILEEVKKKNVRKDRKFKGMLKAPAQGINFHNLSVLCEKVDGLNTDILNYCYKNNILVKHETPNIYGLYNIGSSKPESTKEKDDEIAQKQEQLAALRKEKQEHEKKYNQINKKKEETAEEFYDSFKKFAREKVIKTLEMYKEDSLDEPSPVRIEETKEVGRMQAQFIDLPAQPKFNEEHIYICYKAGNQNYLHIKKPNCFGDGSSDSIHVHMCSFYGLGNLSLDVRKKCGREIITEFVDKYYLPTLKDLELNYLDKDDELVKTFLNECIVNPMDQLILNERGLMKYHKKKRVPYAPYKDSILKSFKNVKESVKLGYFQFNSKEISEVVQNCCHITQFLEIENSNITVDSDFNFGNRDTHIDVISFKNTKFSSSTGIKKAAENIVKAISNSALQYSLKEIRRSGCNIGDTILEDCLKDQDLDIVVVSTK
ncbi:unnamed protein product [Moneuplotes crassus]|uniref:Uncharacterized protein n=1 Tax=Euplotes crassus TaxID=5936 RepID=A0AAD1UC86_EUPCR|nr:unnamed protein product [Moneuplotes crassus]